MKRIFAIICVVLAACEKESDRFFLKCDMSAEENGNSSAQGYRAQSIYYIDDVKENIYVVSPKGDMKNMGLEKVVFNKQAIMFSSSEIRDGGLIINTSINIDRIDATATVNSSLQNHRGEVLMSDVFSGDCKKSNDLPTLDDGAI